MREDPAPAARPRPVWPAALFVFLVAVAWFHFGRDGTRDGRFEIDEAEWVAMGVHTWQLATGNGSADLGASEQELRAADGRPWRLGIEESTFGWMYPLLPKLAFGAAAAATGLDRTTRTIYPRFRPQDPGRSRAARDEARALLAPGLAPARLVVACVAAGVAALLFLVAAEVAGRLAGACCVLLWLASPTARAVAVHVRTDLFPILFGLAALLVAMRWRRALSGARGFAALVTAALGVGVACGLSVGSKLNGALVSFAVPLWFLALHAGRTRLVPAVRYASVGLLASGLVCAGLFWLCLPGLHGDPPVAAVKELLQRWDSSLAHQVRIGPADLPTPESFLARCALALRRVVLDAEPANELLGVPLGVAAVPLGVGWLTVRARENLTSRLVLAFVGVVGLGTVLWIPHDRPRFFLPLVVLVVLLEGLLLGVLLTRSARRDRSTAR